MKIGAKFPSRMPTNWVLKQIAFPPPQSAFLPSTSVDGSVRPPRFSPRDQDRIRKACRMADLDPTAVVGLPDVADRMGTAKTAAIAKPAVRLQPKGSKKELDRYNREKKIAENMSKMPERIAAWKEERRKAKEAAKPEMPF